VGYSGNSAVKTVAPITPEKEGNTYRFRRVAGAEDEGYDCAKLIAQHKGIFGETR